MSRGTLDPARLHLDFAYGIITLFDASFQTSSAIRLLAYVAVLNPKVQSTLVWPVSRSLATT